MCSHFHCHKTVTELYLHLFWSTDFFRHLSHIRKLAHSTMLAFCYCIHVTNHSRLLNFSHGILWVQLLEECSSPLLLVQTVVLVEVDPSHPVSLGSPRIVSLAAPVTRFGTPSICFPSGPCYQIWHPISIYFLGRLFLRVYFVPRAIESKSNTSFYDPSSSFHCFGFFFQLGEY